MSRTSLVKQTALMAAAMSVLAAGGWFVALRGVHGRLQEARRALQRQEAVLAAGATPAVDAAARTEEYERRAAQLRRVIADTPTADGIYERLQRAAAASGVKLDRIEPVSGSRRIMDLTRQAGVAVEPVAVELRARGSFASLAAFTEQVEHCTGLCKVTSVKVLPAEDSTPRAPTAALQLTCTHFTAAEAGPAVLPAARKEGR